MRALVVDAEERVLLMRWEHTPGREAWWITPGGGVQEGESDEAALRRELDEEAGLQPADVGPAVWRREHVLPFGGRIVRQRERFHLLRVDSHEVAPTLDLATENVTGWRWWTLDELAETSEQISPRGLEARLRALLRDGPPAEPLDLGV